MNHASTTHSFARAVSVFGHPMLALPLAALALACVRGQYRTALWMIAAFPAFAVVVMGYSAWQVRRGHWSHVDASNTGERRSLNRFLLIALLASTALAVAMGGSQELTLVLGLSAAMVGIALLTARWWKLSLHMAFVVFAACLLAVGASWWLGLIALTFACLVAWSRLALQRHVPRDLIAGVVAGAAAGVAFAGIGMSGVF